MTRKRVLETILIWGATIFVVGVALWPQVLYRIILTPVPRVVEDANVPSRSIKGQFTPWLDRTPASVANVYEYEGNRFYPDVLLKFTIRDPGEYETYKSRITGAEHAEVAAAFPEFSRRGTRRKASWWTPPDSTVYRIVYRYFAFDDSNQVVYVMRTNPD